MAEILDNQAATERLQSSIGLFETGVLAKEHMTQEQLPNTSPDLIQLRLIDWLGHEGYDPNRFKGFRPRRRKT